MSTTITGLPNATTPLSGTERVPMDQAGTTKDATTQDIANLAPGTDLSYDPATRLLVTSTGTDVTLPLATDALAGLMSAAQRLLTQALIDAGVSVTGGTVTIPHIHGDLAGSIYIHVKNTSGAQLTKGTPVRVTGAVGDTTTLEVATAESSGTGTMPAIGILSDTLAINASGHCVVAGELTGLATGSYSVGQTLYVASGGGLTNTLPTTGVAQAVAIVGRVHASTGSVTVTVGTPTTAGAAGVTDGDKGDITVSASGATWTIDNDVVSYAKIQNVSATSRILGRATAGAGDIEELTLGPGITLVGTTITSEYVLGIACSDEVSDLTVGTAKVTFRMPFAATLTAIRANVNTAPTGSTIVVDLNEEGTSVLSTKLSIDASEKTSVTAAVPVVISDSSLADDAEMTIDFDQVGATIKGRGLKVWLYLRRV